MAGWPGRLLNWVACHLIALGAAGFAVVGVALLRDAPQVGPERPVSEQPALAPSETGTGSSVSASDAGADRQAAGETRPGGGESGDTEAAETPRSSTPVADDARFRPLTPEERGEEEPVASSEGGLRPLDSGTSRLPARALLERARKAFWDGRSQDAEALYLRYLELRPNDANGYGELGNLYRSQGRTREALEAYYQAGLRLRARGDRKALLQVADWLRQAGDPRADALTAGLAPADPD